MGRVGIDRVVVGVFLVTIKGMGDLVVYRRGVYELIGEVMGIGFNGGGKGVIERRAGRTKGYIGC